MKENFKKGKGEDEIMSADLRKPIRCPGCGAMNHPDSCFCQECGAPLGRMRTQNPDGMQNQRQQMQNPGGMQNQQMQTAEKSSNTTIIAAVVAGIAVVFVIGVVIALVVFGNSGRKQTRTTAKTSSMESEDMQGDNEEDTAADVQADIDAVNNRSCTVQGTIYYTDNSKEPVLVLKEAQSVYVNSTTGEKILYNSVSSISLASYPITGEKMKRYNNVEVAVDGALWAEDDVIYMDVDDVFGEPKEEVTEKKTEKETEPKAESRTVTTPSNADYILPDSDKKYLTSSDVAGLSVREINYAKNEIYARHGRKFDSKELREYFESKSWYYGSVSPSDFSTKVFNKYENANIQFLDKKEKELGVYQLDQ